ncbi:hypothetical protein DMH27_22300 [Raoultella planticola]|nr:hypothetical protein [Raoultella planticola]
MLANLSSSGCICARFIQHHDASRIQAARKAACMMMFFKQEIKMLDTNMKTQLKAYLEKLTKPVELVATLDDSAKSAEIKELLAEIAELSEKSDIQRR